MSEHAAPDAVPELIAGRYQVEEVLGRGGMGTVYRVRDRDAGRVCALKRGSANERRRSQRREAMLEREYHTLAQLVHPRIIEVYEYGVDERGPFYTMELLSGDDLANAGSVDWRVACALLRDVASSLAILHARGLIHRDISLRNVRRTHDGRAKLIDFGAMTAMGASKELVGTPPFIAPEVLQLQELDARCDLFGLGAVGYYLLTGRHAYPARRVHELRDVWRSRPASPARLAPEVPAQLSALILQLLSLDRNARPKSAAEVMERLNVLAGLPIEEHAEVSRAYLTTPTLIGREQTLVAARREILSLVRRAGGTLLVEGVKGAGRSRMLDACVLEGKLLGITVVRADASDGLDGPWGVARALCSQLITLMPVEANEAMRLSRDLLGHVLEAARGDEPLTLSAAAPERSQLLRALRDLVLSLARSQRLLLVVDDVGEIDEPSAAFVAALAHKSARAALLLVVALEAERGNTRSASLRLLRLVGRRLELPALAEEQTLTLLGSIFGDVPNLQLVAARIHALAQGNPGTTMELARHLVGRNLARYQAGSWLLPSQLDDTDLPQTLTDALTGRMAELSPAARALLELHAIAEGETLTLSDYATLLHDADHKQLYAASDELIAARVLRSDGSSGHHSLQLGFGAVALAQIPPARRRELHARMAELFTTGGRDVVLRADHLLRSGDAQAGVALLCSIDLQVRPPSVALLERAIEAALQASFPARSVHLLRAAVLSKASVVLAAESFRQQLPLVLRQLEHDSGLTLHRELSELPASERLQQALGRAHARYLAAPEAERVLPVSDAIRELARLSGAVFSFATQLFDLELLATLPSLAPLEPLSPALVVIRELLESSLEWIRGRQLRHRELSQRTVERVTQPDRGGMDEAQARRTRLALHYGMGLFDASMGLSSAEERARVLDEDRDFRVNAARIRMLMHLNQGNAEEARRCERRAELLLLSDSSEQRYLKMGAAVELAAYAEMGDLLGVKSCLETLALLAQHYPEWRAMHAYGQARYRWLQGDLIGALALVESALPHARPLRHNFFIYVAGAHVRLLSELGRLDEGLRLGREYLALVEREDISVPDVSLWIGLGDLLGASGAHAEASALLERAIQAGRELGRAGLALGVLYEARARLAIRSGDREALDHYAELCGEEYKRAKNPALGAKLSRLVEDALQQQIGASEPLVELREQVQHAAPSEYNSVHSHMIECIDQADRARCALTLLLQNSDSASGYLFGVGLDDVPLLAALPDAPFDPKLTDWVRECSNNATRSEEDVTADDASDETQSQLVFQFHDSEARLLEAVFLRTADDSRIAAVLVLHVEPGRRKLPSARLLADCANELLGHGDVWNSTPPDAEDEAEV